MLLIICLSLLKGLERVGPVTEAAMEPRLRDIPQPAKASQRQRKLGDNEMRYLNNKINTFRKP